jgi:hypothetical protein
MGMHFGLIAARVSVEELRAAFLRTWPEYEVVATGNGFANSDAVWSWMKSHEEFVSSANWTKDNPGKTTYAFWRDGRWAVLLDLTYVLVGDEEKLGALSSQLGTVVSFCVETAGGSAAFWCYESGRLRRTINYSDGDMTHEGEPLTEEAGIDINCYYMAETEALMRAFGLSSPDEIPLLNECQAVSVIDHTDYSYLHEDSGSQSPESSKGNPVKTPQSPPEKPWWRFW